MSFYDAVFDIKESQGTVLNITFNNTILENIVGVENRVPNWNSPLLSYDLSKALSYKSDRDYLRDFFSEIRGDFDYFLYRDWSDYQATSVVKTNYYGSSTQGILYPLPDGLNREFQLLKTYQVGSAIHYRPITRIEPGTLEIFGDTGTNLSIIPDTLWNKSAGKITFIAPPENPLVANFSFYVPVSFAQKEIRWRLNRDNKNKKQIYSLESFTLEEKRENYHKCPVDNFDDLPDFELDGWINSVTSIKDEWEIIDLPSGYSKQTTRYRSPKAAFSLDRIVLDDQKLDYLIAFWRCTKGRALTFNISDRSFNNNLITVRFDDDNLSLGLTKKGLYTNDNLKLIEVKELFFDRETYVQPIIDASGSMDAYIPPIVESINALRDFLRQNVYGDEATTNKYFKAPAYYNDERWLNWAGQDLRDSPSEPNKQAHLIWINESAGVYHTNSGSAGEPNSFYTADLNNFLSNYDDRVKFRTFIYSISAPNDAFLQSIIDNFERHLEDAINGTNNYSPALKDYDFIIRTGVESTVQAEFFFNDIINS